MIRFIDTDNQVTYCGDKPYTFYISESCSTGKWYARTIVFLCDQPTITITIPDDSKFHLVELPTTESDYTTMYYHTYGDLSKLICQQLTSDGVQYGDYFFHEIHIAFLGDSEGEMHDTLIIGDSEFDLGADVYMDDERLSTDLAVMGFEMPQQFQRAMYTTNVRDESSDLVLVNRKWKELLIDYWQTLANKGSYSSLINSLKFFEYGDLVKIYEYWRSTDQFGNEELISHDLEQILDPLFHKYLDVMSKTTYISLQMALNELKNDSNAVTYETVPMPTEINLPENAFIPEVTPQLQDIALRWSVDDLAMKMTLLANFFSTYFMPVHIDLMHSSVDKIVFSSCIKILRSVRRRREDHFENLSQIKCNLTTDNEYWLTNCEAYNLTNTMLRNDHVPTYWGQGPVVGMDPTNVTYDVTFSDSNIDEIKKFLNQRFGGVGVLIPVHTEIQKIVNFLKTVRISIYKRINDNQYQQQVCYTMDYILDSQNEPVHIDFNLLFTQAGHYCISLQMVDVNGGDYVGMWHIDVYGDVSNRISIEKLSKIDYTTVSDSDMYDDWFYNNTTINDFMFTQPYDDQIVYKQWLVPSDMVECDGIGTNHTLVIDCGSFSGARQFTLTCEGLGIEKTYIYDIETIDELRQDFPHYWWQVMTRTVARRTGRHTADFDTNEQRYYIIGVRKYIDSDGGMTRNIYTKQHQIYRDGELDDIYNVIIDYVSSRTPVGRGFIKVTSPVGTRLNLNNTGWITTTTETSTIPVKRGISDLSIEYTIGNHLFKKDFTISDAFIQYSQPEYQVHCTTRKRGMTTIDTSRFYPIFHKTQDVTDQHISRKDVIVCKPDLVWLDKKPDTAYWEFVNRTTGEVITSQTMTPDKDIYIHHPYVGHYDYCNELSKGYYDVILHYMMGGIENTETVKSAFVIE